jgi:predicted nucleic acid-binding Zn ribbon protein
MKPAYLKPPRAMTWRRAGEAVGAALAFRGITDAVRGERLLAEWLDFVGARIAARTRPDGIYDRVLVIEVASSAWLHELNLLRAQILAGLLERVGEPRLFDELKFKIAGRVNRRPTSTVRPRAAAKPAAPEIAPATGLAREQIVRETEAVADVELRELIRRVRIANDR